MSRIAIPTTESAPAAARPLLEAVGRQLGTVPNLFRLAALSPAALEGYLSLSRALTRVLDGRTRERIAIAVAEVNGCDYCLSAHAYLGATLAKLDPAEIARNRAGGSGDARADAAVQFAVAVARTRGRVDDAALAAVRAAGFGDAEIVEIVAVVAENVLTNMLNNVARTEIDFPVLHTAPAV